MLGEVTPGHERTPYGTSEVNGMGGNLHPIPDEQGGLSGSLYRNHSRRTKAFPEGFSERLKRFHEESGLSMSENARRLRDLTGPPYGLYRSHK